MTNSERASYIRGLMDGLDLNAEAKETKVLNAVVDLLEGLCQSMDELEDDVAEMAEQVDEIDEDLGTLERTSTAWRRMRSAAAAATTITTGTRILRTPSSR